MADNTPIEWADATVNAINGCTLVSEGCRHCYAARLAATRMRDHPTRAGLARTNAAGEHKFTGKILINERAMLEPLSWRKPRRIFWNAHGDTFHEAVPVAAIDRMFAVMALTPHHTHMVLTKRPERMWEYLADIHAVALRAQNIVDTMEPDGIWSFPDHEPWIASGWPLPNVWLGTSVEDQATADARIPHLLATPAAVRFISAEPLLGWVDLRFLQPTDPPVEIDALNGSHGVSRPHSGRSHRLDLVIVGGESGPHARPMHPDWARLLRDQCKAADTSFFFKQWGEWLGGRAEDGGDSVWFHAASCPDHNRYLRNADQFDWFDQTQAHPNGPVHVRVGKRAAGRLLDGVEHNAMPEPKP